MPSLALTITLWAGCAGAVLAANVTFTGTLAASCSLALGTSGTMALSADGQYFGSQEGIGTPGSVTVVSIGSNTINVAAPTRISAAPSGYNSASEQLQVAYDGVSLLAGVTQAYTSMPTNVVIGTIALSILTINNRIYNPNGFAAGTYTLQTVVTCS